MKSFELIRISNPFLELDMSKMTQIETWVSAAVCACVIFTFANSAILYKGDDPIQMK